MIKVKVDIAGFYFGVVTQVEPGMTIRGVMNKIADVAVPTSNGTTAKLEFRGNDRKFLDKIQVTFPNEAPKPRQAGSGLKFPSLTPGVYAATDETRVLTSAGVAELTWQYYVNEATFDAENNVTAIGKVLNAEPVKADGDFTVRQVRPFGEFELTRDSLVVWRLIAIMVAGDPLPGAEPKAAV